MIERADRMAIASLLFGTAISAILWNKLFPDHLFPVDDAYITIRNADLLSRGAPDTIFGSHPLRGATSILHLALVTIGSLVMSAPEAAVAVAWLGTFALLVATYGMLRVAGTPRGWALAMSVAVPFIGAQLHVLNGLETGITMAMVSASLAAHMAGRPMLLAGLCGTLPFVRPELAALSALLLGDVVVSAWRSGERSSIGRMAGVVALAVLPWLAWLWISTGSPVPTTAGAKRAFFAEGPLPAQTKLTWMSASLRSFAWYVGPWALGLIAVRSRTSRLALAFSLVFLGAYFLYFPGALSHYEHRYMHVLVPAMVLGLGHELATDPGRSRPVVILALLWTLLQLPNVEQTYRTTTEFTRTQLTGIAEVVEREVPEGEVVLIHDAGYLPWAVHRPMVDFVGLKTPNVVWVHREYTLPSSGRDRPGAVAEIARHHGAQWAVLLDGWDRIFGFRGGLEATGWTLEEIDTHGAYDLLRITPPPEARPPGVDR